MQEAETLYTIHHVRQHGASETVTTWQGCRFWSVDKGILAVTRTFNGKVERLYADMRDAVVRVVEEEK